MNVLSLVASTARNRPHPGRRAWRDEDCPQDAEDAEKQTENKACAEAALFSVCDGPRDCATPNQDNHQSR
jgi:hypothetical protein